MTKYSQRNKRWADWKIGESSSTLGRYGCLITCLGMMADLEPHIVESRLKFQKDLILWQSIKKEKIGLKFIWRAYIYDNAVVKETIKEQGFCLVEVDWDGSPKTTGKHWVLFIGNGKMIDPWTGRECLTSKYPLLTGFAIIKVYNQLEEPPEEPFMTKDEKRALVVIKKFKENSEPPHGNLEGAANAAIGAVGDLVISRGMLKNASSLLNTAEKTMKELRGKLASKTKKHDKLAVKLSTANKKITKLGVEVETEVGLKNQYRRWWEKAKDNDYNNMKSIKLVIILLKRFKRKKNAKKIN